MCPALVNLLLFVSILLAVSISVYFNNFIETSAFRKYCHWKSSLLKCFWQNKAKYKTSISGITSHMPWTLVIQHVGSVLRFDLFYNEVLGNNFFCHLRVQLLTHTFKVYAYCSDFPLLYFVIPSFDFKHLWYTSLFVLERNRGEKSYPSASQRSWALRTWFLDFSYRFLDCGLHSLSLWQKHTERPFHRDNRVYTPPLLPKYTATHWLISYWVAYRTGVVWQTWLSWLCVHFSAA